MCEAQPQEVPTTLKTPHLLASFISFQGSPCNGWLEMFFSAFILKVPAANTYLNCHWLTAKDRRVRFPNINVPQENNSFCQAHIE